MSSAVRLLAKRSPSSRRPHVTSAGVESPADMSVADLLAEHGSPLWLANLDVVRDRQRSFTAAWRWA